MHYESGTSVKGRGSISKMGDARVRQVLYLAAMSAVRHNVACRVFYVRLRQTGRAHKHAVVAWLINSFVKLLRLFDSKLCLRPEVRGR